MNTSITFPAQGLTLFRETLTNSNNETNKITRGTLRTLPVGFAEPGLKPCVRIYARDQEPQFVEQMKSLLVKKGVAETGNPYGYYGRVIVTAEVCGTRDFEDGDENQCREYQLKVTNIERAPESAIEKAFDDQF